MRRYASATPRYTYNAGDWLAVVNYPDGTGEWFEYYSTGSLWARHDGRGQATVYARNALDQVTTIDYPAGTDPTFTYDAKGRVTRMTLPGNVVWSYGYDYGNRLATVSTTGYTAAFT